MTESLWEMVKSLKVSIGEFMMMKHSNIHLHYNCTHDGPHFQICPIKCSPFVLEIKCWITDGLIVCNLYTATPQLDLDKEMHLSDVYHGENVQMFWQKKRKKAPNEVLVNSHKKTERNNRPEEKEGSRWRTSWSVSSKCETRCNSWNSKLL